KNRWFIHTPGGFLDFYILSGPSFPAITAHYCELTGFPVLPPKWLLGFWVSWASPYYRVEEYMEIAARLRREEWPFDVMVADMNWRGGDFNIFLEGDSGNNLDWHDKRFGDGRKLIELLHQNNAHLCLHLNTVMYTGELLEEGLRSGALRKVEEGVVVPRVMDKEALEWYWDTHEPRIEDGVDLWWTDNGERVNGVLANGLPSRNLFGHLWNKAIFTKMEQAGKPARLVLSRGGWLGAQQFTLTWPGDTGPGVERLREDLRWHLNCSVSGIPYNTVDFGGFMILSKHFRNEQKEWMEIIIHSNENIIRRVAHCMLLFTVPRIHGVAKLPWMYSKETAAMWRFFLNLRYRIFPYIYSWIVRGTKTGEPVYRPLVWMHQDDPDVYDIDDELYCGDDLLFAPVVEEGAMEREVYLPEGSWLNFWTGEAIAGQSLIIADAAFFEPAGLPFFIRQGAILPLRSRCQYNRERHETELIIHIFSGGKTASGKRRFYDSHDLYYDISYTIQGKKLHMSLNNPLTTERKITAVWHFRPRKISTDADLKSYPFEEEAWDIEFTAAPKAIKNLIIDCSENNDHHGV
ncbi:MAG: glycoside hydrolase family 31 protein, partial [Spirochaetia bacterium]